LRVAPSGYAQPGNYFVQADGRLGVMSFGMVGAPDEATRRAPVLLMALALSIWLLVSMFFSDRVR
jgi:hypothetical protein